MGRTQLPVQLRIVPVKPDVAVALRGRFSLGHLPADQRRFPGDDADDTLHVAAYAGGAPVGVATVLRDPKTFEGHGEVTWRLRGLGVDPLWRRLGVGRALIDHRLAHVAEHDAACAWASVRTGSLDCQRSAGAALVEGAYEVEGAGQHLDVVHHVTARPYAEITTAG